MLQEMLRSVIRTSDRNPIIGMTGLVLGLCVVAHIVIPPVRESLGYRMDLINKKPYKKEEWRKDAPTWPPTYDKTL